MVLAVFISYMAFIFKTNMPIVTSIMLMIVALFCVAGGLVAREKKVRVYGLVLSLVVCAKIVLYDFFGAPTFQRTLVLFVVGCIALIISTVYMVLGKRFDLSDSVSRQNERNNEG